MRKKRGIALFGLIALPIVLQHFASAQPSLCKALDACDVEWVTEGRAPWFGQKAVNHDGVGAAQSGKIRYDEKTSLKVNITGPARVAFYDKVSSEGKYDFLGFYIDGAEKHTASGEADWTLRGYFLGEGRHTLEWRYSKDGSMTKGADTAWLDQFMVFTAADVGSLQVSLEPAEADMAGVQWSLDGKSWQNSGVILSELVGGVYTVTYRPAFPWAAPENKTILVLPGETTQVTGTCTKLPDSVGMPNKSWKRPPKRQTIRSNTVQPKLPETSAEKPAK
jgi:hypothetical protein